MTPHDQFMTNTRLFIELLHRLENYDDAVVLMVLLTLGADKLPIRATLGQFRQSHLGGMLTPNRVAVAVEHLQNHGLLHMDMPTVRLRRSRYGELSVDRDAVLALLRQPMVYTEHMPGISEAVIPLLRDAVLDTELAELPPVTTTVVLQGLLPGRNHSPSR
ncbi:MAG: hypothetical protein ACKOF9_13600 [Burkholderiales bacterium]